MFKRNGAVGILFVDGGEESKRLLTKFSVSKLLEKLKVVDVSKNGLRGWLLLEYGTTEVPLLVTEDAVLSDPKSIEEYVEKLRKQ
ncbi:hypothetical protein IG193_05475 [Infirmifilum lucidum]|uniref:GST N-terminal domain-containing protein n=1 Tax=Infirmifilum lucidum TaxID=2776706 RepID=A0A7L9FHH3_9CREN|nr:hypothetical protein [Infirmifilum lucidum]QOJ78225.1 hypothetical protein IG193_05475 [Infirmifilum lucidum]